MATHRFNFEFPEPLIIPNPKQRDDAPKKFKITGKIIIVASAKTTSSDVKNPKIKSGSNLIMILPIIANTKEPKNPHPKIFRNTMVFFSS